MGVRVMRMRAILIFLSALLAAVSVSVAGMLGFVGLIGTDIKGVCRYMQN